MFRIPDEEGREHLARIHRTCYAIAPDRLERWWAYAGHDNLRLYEDCAGLIDIPMGQYFGGRPVRMHGVAAVGVLPEARGRGHASKMMAAYLRELAAKDVTLSTLYASTAALYRGVGYEWAGSTFTHELEFSRIALGASRDGTVRRMTPADEPAVEAFYAEVAQHRHGWLQRGPYIWFRVREESIGYVVDGPDGIEGYARLRNGANTGDRYPLLLRDGFATTERAGRRLLALLASHGAMNSAMKVSTGLRDPLLELIPEFRHSVELYEPWMLRIVDVAAAMTERGWIGRGSVELAITDAVLEANAGSWVLTVGDGATMERGGSGRVVIDITDLAALYTGWADPWTLRAQGRLTASDADLIELARVFAGFAPQLGDRF